MKCGFCGNELEKGSEICPNCGMIISLGDENDSADDKVVESVYNVFKSNVENEKSTKEKAQELEADPTEEKVEFVMSLPEFDEAAEPIKNDEDISDTPDVNPAEKVSDEPSQEDMQAEFDASLPQMEDIPLPETLMGDRITGDIYSSTADEANSEPEKVEKVALDEADSEDESQFEVVEPDSDSAEEKEEKLDIRVPESNYIYADYDDYAKDESDEEKQEKSEKAQKAKENLDKISPDEKKKPVAKKKKKNKNNIDGIKIEAVLAVAIVIIAVIFGCAYAAKKNIIPVIGDFFNQKETTTAANTSSSEDETTTTEEAAEETTTEEATEETTTKPTTEESTKETTTKETTTKPTTSETTKKTTEQQVVPTTKPSTTKPSTTKPSTTKPSTTKPSTTKPSTTKPTTTKNPYGINNVAAQKPSSYLSKSYTAYVSAEGVILRSAPSSKGVKILCLSKGADVKVLAKQNGFYYIYSNRYGVYGWISASYILNERPTTNAVTVSGTVTPDKKYDTAEIKYTTNGLNVRKGPGTSYGIVGLVPISYPVKVIGYKSGVSGWVYVEDLTYGYTGWVSTAYLK